MTDYRIEKRYNILDGEGACTWVSRLAALADIKEAEARAVVAENERDRMTRERDTLERSLEAVKRDYRRASDAYDEAVRQIAALRSQIDNGGAMSVTPDWLAPDLRAAGEAMSRVREVVKAQRERAYINECAFFERNHIVAEGANSVLDVIEAALGPAPDAPATPTAHSKAERAVESIRQHAENQLGLPSTVNFEIGYDNACRDILRIIEEATR